MNKTLRKKKYSLSPGLSLLAAVLLAGGITVLALWCQPNSLLSVARIFKAQPLLILLNALPVGLLLLTLSFLLGNVFYGAALVNLFVCGLSIANRIKIEVRDEPVFPRDLGLLREVGSAVKTYSISYPWAAIAVTVLTTLLLFLAGHFLKCRPLAPGHRPPSKKGRLFQRLLGAAASFGILVALIFTVYASGSLYGSFDVSNSYYVPAVFNELGFPYCFCHQFTTYPVNRPSGFRKSQAAAWETGDQTGLGKNVNVIFVMDESFSDITDEAMFDWTPETDPLSNLHALARDPHALTGHIVVPGFAGGTANTEFDVMTGMQTNALSGTATSAMRVVNRNLDSLFRIFGADGYETSYFHPGDAWFYNRENVLKWLGADTTVFVEDMEGVERKGRWVTDNYMAGQIEEEFERAAAEGRPLFHYTTTIQNHLSYTATKYGQDHSFAPVPVSADISDETRTMLEVYTEGVRDADAMLGRLVAYFRRRQEPVVLVFYGDHLPYLGDNQKGYADLGSDIAAPADSQQDPLSPYKTPYVIWANDAAAEALSWSGAVSALGLPEDGTISAAFLGSVVLDLTGRTQETAWFRFLSSLRRMAPVIQKETYILADGRMVTAQDLAQSTDETDTALVSAIQKWRCWSYYKLKYKVVA